jgi:hypothetical protein
VPNLIIAWRSHSFFLLRKLRSRLYQLTMGDSRATCCFLLFTLNIALGAANEGQAGKLCTELSNRRERLSSLHEELIVRQTFTPEGHTKSATSPEILDFGAGKCRQAKRSLPQDFVYGLSLSQFIH